MAGKISICLHPSNHIMPRQKFLKLSNNRPLHTQFYPTEQKLKFDYSPSSFDPPNTPTGPILIHRTLTSLLTPNSTCTALSSPVRTLILGLFNLVRMSEVVVVGD